VPRLKHRRYPPTPSVVTYDPKATPLYHLMEAQRNWKKRWKKVFKDPKEQRP